MAETPPDTLTQTLGVLLRRETEARILAPVIAALAEKFGADEVHAVVRDAIIQIARDQGAALAEQYGNSSDAFMETLQFWTQNDALQIEVLHHDADRLDFDVKRCRYAEMYNALGIPA